GGEVMEGRLGSRFSERFGAARRAHGFRPGSRASARLAEAGIISLAAGRVAQDAVSLLHVQEWFAVGPVEVRMKFQGAPAVRRFNFLLICVGGQAKDEVVILSHSHPSPFSGAASGSIWTRRGEKQPKNAISARPAVVFNCGYCCG